MCLFYDIMYVCSLNINRAYSQSLWSDWYLCLYIWSKSEKRSTCYWISGSLWCSNQFSVTNNFEGIIIDTYIPFVRGTLYAQCDSNTLVTVRLQIHIYSSVSVPAFYIMNIKNKALWYLPNILYFLSSFSLLGASLFKGLHNQHHRAYCEAIPLGPINDIRSISVIWHTLACSLFLLPTASAREVCNACCP